MCSALRIHSASACPDVRGSPIQDALFGECSLQQPMKWYHLRIRDLAELVEHSPQMQALPTSVGWALGCDSRWLQWSLQPPVTSLPANYIDAHQHHSLLQGGRSVVACQLIAHPVVLMYKVSNPQCVLRQSFYTMASELVYLFRVEDQAL